MAFDFLYTMFGLKKSAKKAREVPAKKEKKQLEAANILSWLNGQLAKEIELEREKFSSMAGDLLQLVKDLRKTVENIRQKSFEAGDRTYAAVNMIKDTWAKKALMSFSSYNREIRKEKISPEKIDFPVFRDIYHNTVRLMNDISMIPRQKLVLSRYFELESKRMSEILHSLGTLVESMRLAVSGSGTLKGVNRVKNMLDRLGSLGEETARIGKDIENARSAISRKELDIENLSKEISSIEKDPEWKELAQLDKKIKDGMARREEIELEVAAKLGSMKRVFKLFAHDATNLEKEEKKLFEDLSHSPLKTFMSSDARSIENILNKLEQDIESGTFRLSKKDGGKTGELKHILESGWVLLARSEHAKMQLAFAEANKKKDEINVIVLKRESERGLEKNRAELDILRRQESELEKKLKEKSSELLEKKREISGFVQHELGSEVELD